VMQWQLWANIVIRRMLVLDEMVVVGRLLASFAVSCWWLESAWRVLGTIIHVEVDMARCRHHPRHLRSQATHHLTTKDVDRARIR